MIHQLDLFEAQAKKRLGGGPSCVDRMWERAQSPEVESETLAIAESRPGEWLSWFDFSAVIEKHEISGCFGHILFSLVRTGKLVEQKIYLGAKQPNSGNYQGYYSNWRAA